MTESINIIESIIFYLGILVSLLVLIIICKNEKRAEIKRRRQKTKENKRMKTEKLKKCKKCNKRTKHIKCGFGTVGGLVGNARWECEECRSYTKC